MLSAASARDDATGAVAEQEVQSLITAWWVGIWLSVVVVLGCEAYALATWSSGEHRDLILVVTTLGLLSVPVLINLPIERMVRHRRREWYFVAWTAFDIVLLACAAALDGGSESPFALLLVLPFLYAALTYTLTMTAMVAAIDLLAFLAIAVLVGGGVAYSAMGAFSLVCVAILGAWHARSHSARQRALVETAQALVATEKSSRLRAAQQREVARLGQRALTGAGIPELRIAVVNLVERVLEVDLAAVLKVTEGGEGFEFAASVGIPENEARRARVPGGRGSQSGYTLATGAPTVVTDWATETRFSPSPIAAKLGTVSGVIVLIKGKGSPYGVLGAQTLRHREFTAEDVSFLQALANVLANAIERRSSEERVQHEALHDPLTDLPNRNLFFDRLGHALAQTRRHDSAVAVLFLDLDQFKLVNDSLGHAAGDELLASVAPRLQSAVRPGDTVARFGGDEFAVLAEDVSSERDAVRVAERIAEALTRPFVLRQREHFASVSIGIAIGAGPERPEDLVRDADAALYRAKDRGRGGYEIFDEVMRSRAVDHMRTENDLRRALQRSELELHYQPVIDLRDRSIVMLEALLRWRHPERGLLVPAAFIPVAEESRLIVPIGHWVIEQACLRAAAWQALDPDASPIGVAVNLSAPQLADSRLVRSVQSAVETSGIDPSTLRLELTERTLFEEAEDPEPSLRALQGLGVRLLLDDFGRGFSPLGYLKRLPLSGIKLDRTFSEDLSFDGRDAAIVRAINELAGALQMDVCAGGIETAEQLEAVEALGCTHAQGFLLGRPQASEEIDALLRDRPASRGGLASSDGRPARAARSGRSAGAQE